MNDIPLHKENVLLRKRLFKKKGLANEDILFNVIDSILVQTIRFFSAAWAFLMVLVDSIT